MSPFEAEVLTLLRRIAIALERRPVPSEADQLALAALLPAIDAWIGVRYDFTAGELVAHASASGSALLSPLEVACGTPLNSHRLSKFLRRVDGIALDGLRIEQVGAGRGGLIRVLRRA